jgi:putative glycosyltransferase (TIGR04372 family)
MMSPSLNQQSRAYLEQGQFVEAIAVCRQAIVLDPNCADAYQMMAEALQGQSKLELAVRTYQKAFALDSSRSEVAIALGNLHAKLGNPEQSLEYYQRAIALGDERVEVYRALAQLCHQLDRPDAARSYQDKADRLQPDRASAQAHLNAGNNLFQQERHLEVLHDDRASIAVNPKLAQAHFQQGQLQFRQGAWDDALRSYRQAIALQPDLKVARAELLALRQAWDDLEQAMQDCPETISPVPAEAETLFARGNALALQGRLSEAIGQYQQAIALQPNWVEAHFNFANILRKLDNLTGASEYYRQAIALNPNFAPAYFQLGNLLERAGNIAGAIACWQRTVEIDSQWALAYLKMSMAYLIENQHELGVNSAKRAFEIYQKKRSLHSLEKLGIRFWISGRYFHWPWAVKAIGNMAMNIDLHVKMGLLGWRPNYQTILLAPEEDISNPCLLDYWRRYLTIISDPALIARLLPLARQLQCWEHGLYYTQLPNGQVERDDRAYLTVQKEWESRSKPPVLVTSSEDCERGWQCLQELGVPKDAWFVTLHVRESGFYREGDDNARQNYRNANIETYRLAIESIAERGGWVIRAGDPSMKPLPSVPNAIDYARSSFKSDWMDIFLLSQCRFFLGMASGPLSVPYLFGVPCILTNISPMWVRPFSKFDLFIPKLYRSISENRYLTFPEAHQPHLMNVYNGQHFAEWGIEVVDNTPEEIKDVVLEAIARSDGTIDYTADDERLQQQFHSISTAYYNDLVTCRIGRNFLRKYAELLSSRSLKS